LVKSEGIKRKLVRYVIDKSEDEWKKRRTLCWDGVEREIPDSLNGEILLEEVVRAGKVTGWITMTPENLADIISKRDDPLLRLDEEVDFRGVKKRVRELTKEEYEELVGIKKYLDKFRAEGIEI